jgi:hypothetical protein
LRKYSWTNKISDDDQYDHSGGFSHIANFFPRVLWVIEVIKCFYVKCDKDN